MDFDFFELALTLTELSKNFQALGSNRTVVQRDWPSDF